MRRNEWRIVFKPRYCATIKNRLWKTRVTSFCILTSCHEATITLDKLDATTSSRRCPTGQQGQWAVRGATNDVHPKTAKHEMLEVVWIHGAGKGHPQTALWLLSRERHQRLRRLTYVTPDGQVSGRTELCAPREKPRIAGGCLACLAERWSEGAEPQMAEERTTRKQ